MILIRSRTQGITRLFDAILGSYSQHPLKLYASFPVLVSPTIAEASTRRNWLRSCPFSTTPQSSSSPSPKSGRGRSRKHRRRRPVPHISETTSSDQADNNLNSIKHYHHLPYPKGKPWRVLWPMPFGDHDTNESASSSDPRWRRLIRKIPRLRDFKRAWALYLQTWEDGLSGRPSIAKLQQQALEAKQQQEQAEARNSNDKTKNDDSDKSTITSPPPWPDMSGSNAAQNLHLIRQDAAKLLDQAKEQTGIHTKDDLKALAAEMMKLGTECLREFMAGYREGRDQEMDKMLNEYFQVEAKEKVHQQQQQPEQEQSKGQQSEEGPSNDHNEFSSRPIRKRRRPKRGIPRD